MNYLSLVNAVLRRLRESEVTTVQGTGSNNAYARLIGDYINEAKQQIEDAWQWSVLKTTLTVTTAPTVTAYNIAGSRHKFQLDFAYNDTADLSLEQIPFEQWTVYNSLGQPAQGDVTQFTFNGYDTASSGLKILVHPVPTSVQSLKFYGTQRTGNLSADSDVIVIPSRPVILLATAMAIEERGEDSGQQSINAYRLAQSAISDEIAIDAGRQPEQTIWYET